MSVTITYDESNFPGTYDEDDRLCDILEYWGGLFTGSHPDITGEFSGTADNSWPSLFGTPISGSAYTYGSDADGYKFVAEGDLYYYFNGSVTPVSPTPPDDHTLFGEITKISLYTDSDNDGQADDLFLTFDFSGDCVIEGDVQDGHANDVHQVIDDLMSGDVDALMDALEDCGIDPCDTVADLTGESLAAESELLLAA